MPVSRFGARGNIVLGLLGLALVWVVVNTSLVASLSGPLAILTSNLQLFAGLAVILALAYWALDEVEEDDDVTDAVSKTSERAEEASAGFINVTTAVLGGLAAILVTSGDALFSVIGEAPMLAGQFIIGLLGVGGAIGALPLGLVAVGALVVIIGSGIIREEEES